MEVALPVRALVEFVLRRGSIDSRFSGFDRAAEGARIHRKLQKAAGEGYAAEMPLKAERVVDGITYVLDGRADGIFTEADGTVVLDEIKTTAAPAQLLTEDFNPLHWAQAQCYAAFWCEQNALAAITVQVTYYQIDTDEVVQLRRAFTAAALEDFLRETLHLYTRWAVRGAEWNALRTASLRALTFPFPAYRAGQYRLAGAVYRTIAGEKRLFACAPTGIGKTMSTLFPALKAMGEGLGERVFYLTAKNTTHAAAEEALRVLRQKSGTLRLKSVTLTAKDKVCLLPERDCTPEACPYANGYFDRVNDALFDFLAAEDVFTRETIAAYAKKKMLCPFEFALDLSSFCDCIIGDYNYLFDPVVSLKRFFETGGDYIFLIDEAHNLSHRARDMYSAEVKKSDFFAMKKLLEKAPRKLKTALTRVNSAFIALRHAADGERALLLPAGDEPLCCELTHFCAAAEEWLDEHREGEAHAALLQLYFDARFFLRIRELYDDNFTTLVTVYGSEVRVQQLCLDAAQFLDASMARGRAAVLFSATLTPFPYFIQTLGGGEDALRIQLESPFPADHYCLLAADGVSTKYARREDTLKTVCDMIFAAADAHRGNYIAFFPSYKYMQAAAELLAQEHPALALAVQESGMDEAARAAFLARFDAGNAETLLGLCVLGGVFAEGIDLAGERLVGSIIVGVGLPQVGPVQDALRSHYDAVLPAAADACGGADGFDYAYRFPGMNKVLQAAGRVIRTERDRGMTLLIDTRYASGAYRGLFPPHWAHCRSVRTAAEVRAALTAFWAQADSDAAESGNVR